MRKLYILGMILGMYATFSACNDEWKDELYTQMLSFKAPLGDNGLSEIYVRYQPDGTGIYQLPVIVSGSKSNSRNIDAKIAVDEDTLRILNQEKFPVGRQDLWYVPLAEQHYSFESNICHIPAGENIQLYPIHFNFNGLELDEKYVLPLTIEEDPSYVQNKYKGRYKALLGVNLFNDYSGTYNTTLMNIYIEGTTTDPRAVHPADDHGLHLVRRGLLPRPRLDLHQATAPAGRTAHARQRPVGIRLPEARRSDGDRFPAHQGEFHTGRHRAHHLDGTPQHLPRDRQLRTPAGRRPAGRPARGHVQTRKIRAPDLRLHDPAPGQNPRTRVDTGCHGEIRGQAYLDAARGRQTKPLPGLHFQIAHLERLPRTIGEDTTVNRGLAPYLRYNAHNHSEPPVEKGGFPRR